VQNVDRMDRYACISPQFLQVLFERVAGRESMLGDKTSEFASMGTYAGFGLYVSNNLTASARWTPANNPSDADTVTINGVTFTFKSAIGTTAGNVLIAGTTAGTITNLVTLINAPGTTTANGVALSTADQRTAQMWVAVDGTTYIEARAKGASYMTVTGSDVTDVWSVATQHNMFGQKGAVDMVVQKEVSVDSDKLISGGVFGMGVGLLTIFGVRTFDTGAKSLCNVKLASSGF
jgi:hypothetical protein